MDIREQEGQKMNHKSFCNSSNSNTKHWKNESGDNYVLCKDSGYVSNNCSEDAVKAKWNAGNKIQKKARNKACSFTDNLSIQK